nr:zinc finger BED domain-containing protein RICESLEEPER 2 [Tanacetum cinerariifolium]
MMDEYKIKLGEALDSTQIDLGNTNLELGVEKNSDKRAKRKTTGTKRKAPTKKKPKMKGKNINQSGGNSSIQFMKKMKTKTKLGNKQGKLQLKKDANGEGNSSSVATWKHDDERIKKALTKLPNIYDSGKHFQIKCFVHILNLIVKKVLVSDCATKWNSTFDMLKVANELKDAFYKYDLRNSKYRSDLEKVPKDFDFRTCAGFVEFLEKFKVKTKSMSTSTKQLAHLFFGEILYIDTHLRKWQAKPAFKVMATKMRSKYEKYWGNLSEINDFMYFAVLLDPTMKSQLIAHGFRKIIRHDLKSESSISIKGLEQMVSKMVDEVEERMGVLFEMYKERCGFDSSSLGMFESMEHEATSPSHGDNDFLNDFYNGNDTSSIEPETELQRYLKEPKVELRKGQIFDILQWWKVNGPRFLIVARMARDWVRKSRKPINVDSLEDLLNDDKIVKDMEYELEKGEQNLG